MSRLVMRFPAAVTALLLACSVRVWAAPAGDPIAATSALCTDAVAAAEKLHQTPVNLLGTMARVESGRPIPSTGRTGPWPWAI
ncbi:MAG: hypothetical protein JO326_06585, partial [Acetobacteraceae bacterium]|nr:hypothetical protein [Acetobacteraceae bacterium]